MPDIELEFFNSLSGRLHIELSEPTSSPPGLDNQVASSTAQITSLRLTAEFFETDGTFRQLTEQERNQVAMRARTVVLRGEADLPVRHRAPNGKSFTVAELLAAVEETERQTRQQTAWLGDGVDVHHVFFEGMRQTKRFPKPQWTIDWGS